VAHDAKTPSDAPDFTRLIDLAQERLGGLPIHASDEFFAEKDNLVRAAPAVFVEGKYTERGKWMDGWESRRKRGEGHDFCIVRLGVRGRLRGLDVDTSFFLGNHPPFFSLDALDTPWRVSVREDLAALPWKPLVPRTPLAPGAHNYVAVPDGPPATHVRLNIFPDGGVARLRVYGDVVPDFARLGPSEPLDLAAVENGGVVVACNDMFFGPKDNLIMPGRGATMGDGWETKRKRALPGFDWVVVRLGAPGTILRAVIDTHLFKGNHPDRALLEAKLAPSDVAALEDAGWRTLLPESMLEGHRAHAFGAELAALGPVSHVRLKIFPDGGVSRLRLFGTLAPASAAARS
jgi:allantoicase